MVRYKKYGVQFRAMENKYDLKFKTIEKHLSDKEELIKIYGEHISDLRKDTTNNTIAIVEVKSLIKEVQASQEKSHTEIMNVLKGQNVTLEKIQPVIKKYEDDLVIAKDRAEKGEMYLKTAGYIGATTVIGGGLMWAIRVIKNTFI